MNVESRIAIEALAKEFVPRVQEMKNKGAYVELLCSTEWAKIEKSWIEDPINLHISINNLADDLLREFNNASKKVDQRLKDQEFFRKCGPLANYVPDELLVSRNENPPAISCAGVAFGLSKYGLEKVIDGRVETLTTRKVLGSGQLILSGFSVDEKSNSQVLISHTLLRAVINVPYREFCKWDLHLHSEGGQGPSAGLAMFTSLISAWSGKILPADVAFTGELLLTGKVKAVGGLLPKCIGAYRVHIKNIVLPKGMETDAERLPNVFRENIKFQFVESVNDVMDLF